MATKKQGIDQHLIRDLAALLKETDLSEIEIEQEGFRVRVARGGQAFFPMMQGEPQRSPASPPLPDATPATRSAAADPARHPGCVPSPMVGTAYLSPEPNAKVFVEIGDTVSVGQTILIVEAMKHMNEVASTQAGTVTQILVEDGQPVEYGQPLMIIE